MYLKDSQINNSSSNNNNNNNTTNNNDNFSPEKKKIIVEHLLITKNSTSQAKNYSHVPCKFFKQGNCSAGQSCPFSHSMDFKEANKRPCKYFKLGNCKFGNKCANSHVIASKPSSSSSVSASPSSSSLLTDRDTQRNIPTGYFPSTTTTGSTASIATPQYQSLFAVNNNNNNNNNNGYNETQLSMDEKDWLPRTPTTYNNNSNVDNMINYSYQLPSRKPQQQLPQQQQQQQYFPLTPPLSSSSSSSSNSSSSTSDTAFQNHFIPRNFNTSNTLYSKDNFNNNYNNISSPLMFNPTWEEPNNPNRDCFSSNNNNDSMNNYYFNYSSILKTLEEDEEEDEPFYNSHSHYQKNYI